MIELNEETNTTRINMEDNKEESTQDEYDEKIESIGT